MGTRKPSELEMASRSTRPSWAEPSQPGNAYINCMLGAHTPKTFVTMSPFHDLYLPFSRVGTVTFIWVPSKAPKQFLKCFHL